MNARDEGDKRAWIHEKVCEVKQLLLMKHRGQVKVTFSESSRSKAENLNVFGELVSTDKLDYALIFDIDDRPTYSETSLLKCAESLIGTTQNGFKVIGLQGPCIDCFEDAAGLGGIYECHRNWSVHMESQTYGRCSGQWCMGSNFIAETWVFKKYAFNPSLLDEDQAWSIEFLKDGITLAGLPMAISYGQLPQGSSQRKRRKRWDKGGMQLCFHIIRNSPTNCFTFPAKCWAYWAVIWYFVMFPTIIMLTLFGFRVVARNCYVQTGSPWLLDPDQTQDEMPGVNGVMAIVWVWNHIGFASLIAFVCIYVGHLFNTLRFWNRGKFLNARRGLIWFFLQFGYMVVDTSLMLFPLFDYKLQVRQYWHTDMLLDFVFCRLPTWEITEKRTKGSMERIEGDKIIV